MLKSSLAFTIALTIYLISAFTGTAQSYDFTDKCKSRTNSIERDMLRDAYLFAFENQLLMWAEIKDDSKRQSGGTLEQQEYCHYDEVPYDHALVWSYIMQDIKINCEGNKCDNNRNTYAGSPFPGMLDTLLFGLDPAWFNKIRICLGNITRTAGDNNSNVSQGNASKTATEAATFAKVAGAIAHEIMHKADKWEGHGGQPTDPVYPEKSAATVGVAMEHVALSPDLVPAIENITTTWIERMTVPGWTGSGYLVEITGSVNNKNIMSGPAGTVPFSGRFRNNNSNIRISMGSWDETTRVVGIDGGETIDVRTFFDVPTYSITDGVADVIVTADVNNELWELDEDNNTATSTHSLVSDLAIENVVIDGRYEDYLPEYEGDLPVPEYTLWRELNYKVTIRNIGIITTMPSTVKLYYDDMRTDNDYRDRKEQDIGALSPGESTVLEFSVNVPLDGTLDNLTVGERMHLRWVVNEDHEVPEEEFSNNSWEIAFGENYFAPDYQVEIMELEFSGGEAVLHCRAANLGPEPGPRRYRAKLTVSHEAIETEYIGKVSIKKLEPGERRLFTIRTPIEPTEPTVGQWTLLVEIDVRNKIAENRAMINGKQVNGENNNYVFEYYGVNLEMLSRILGSELLVATDKGIMRSEDYIYSEDHLEVERIVYSDRWIRDFLDSVLDDASPGSTFPKETFDLTQYKFSLDQALGRELSLLEFANHLAPTTDTSFTGHPHNDVKVALIYNQQSVRIEVIK